MSCNRNNYQHKDHTSGHWGNLALSTQSASSQQQSEPEPLPQLLSGHRQYKSQPIQQQTQDKPKKKKKKCRGNRKLQRYRAKLRKRGLNNETITALINDYNNTNQDQNEEEYIAPDMDVELLIPLRDQVGSIYGQ
jgi:hypothetical protein